MFSKSRLYLGHVEGKREDGDRDDVDLQLWWLWKRYWWKNDADKKDNNFDDANNDNNYDDDINDDVDQQTSSVRHRQADRSVLVWTAHSNVSETKKNNSL